MKHTYYILSLLFLSILCGCKHSEHDHEHEGHDHEHEAKISLTAYTSLLEFYIEADPFVKGEEGHLLVHLTKLNDFSPLAEGRVTATLTCGDKVITKTVDKPEHPGIYIFEITPQATGAAKLQISVKMKDAEEVATFEGLQVYDDEHEAHEAAEESAPHAGNALKFTKEQAWESDFATAVVEIQPIGRAIKAMALVEPTAAGRRTIVSTTPGRVHILNPSLKAGMQVGAGQTLFRIDASGTAQDDMNLRIIQARNEYDRAKRDYDRIKGLMEQKLATAAELSSARADYEQAGALLSQLTKNFSGGGQSLASPIAGYLQSLDVTDGAWVEAGQPLATVANSRNITLTAKVPARQGSELASLTGALIFPSPQASPVSLASLSGHFLSRGAGIESGQTMVPVSMEMPNTLSLLPGTYVEVLLLSGQGESRTAVPREALLEEMGNTFVLVQITPELFEKRQVTLGATDGYYYEITSGLKESERIVTRGAAIVKLAQGSAALDPHAGHVH